MPQQPELTDDWGVTFYGKAQTVTGDIWWYEQDGRRYPLRPRNVQIGVSSSPIGPKETT